MASAEGVLVERLFSRQRRDERTDRVDEQVDEQIEHDIPVARLCSRHGIPAAFQSRGFSVASSHILTAFQSSGFSVVWAGLQDATVGLQAPRAASANRCRSGGTADPLIDLARVRWVVPYGDVIYRWIIEFHNKGAGDANGQRDRILTWLARDSVLPIDGDGTGVIFAAA
eukprot:951829-Prymnesium_polylepis.1